MKKYFSILAIIPILLLFGACKTLPPEKIPDSTLEFEKIDGLSIHQAIIYYRFKIKNSHTALMNLKILNWIITMDGYTFDPRNAILKQDGALASNAVQPVAPGKTFEGELELYLNLDAYLKAANKSGNTENTAPDDTESAAPENTDYCMPVLTLEISCQYGTAHPITGIVSAAAEFPRIREPEFTITSIAILQAELINTRFAVTLRIDNPNPFPVTLSSLKYELYGQGMYWADGKEQNIMNIPAKDSSQTKLFLMMNFINMKRSLLDEIIAMQNVSYRFTGATDVETGIPWLPRFSMKFDKSGLSEVFQ
ncbi:MAG: LEA type 2 family protein [Treponema sp.]|nr:LEA type 2 family protein [Treponema sp.]